nr:putative ribonuclease H-like domain-containing protein [Tanacetum cinerariifolium]
MIRCLMYLTATRPDIMFAVCAAARHQVIPKTSNLVDYAGANGDRKSTSGGCQFLERRDANKKKLIQVLKIPTEHNVADLLTKSFDVTRFGYLVVNIVFACLVCWTNLLLGNIVLLLVTNSACWNGFCWWSFISAGSSGFSSLLLVVYALTANPTIYASVVRQFWGSASEVSLPDGVKGLVATIDDTVYTVTKASIRSDLHRTKFLMYPRFLQIILDTNSEDTTPYPAPLVTKKIFTNMRHYQGPDMPLLAHMLNLGEPDLEQAQQQDVYQPQLSPVVTPHLSPDPMPSPPMQSSHLPIHFGPAPSSGVVSTEPILDIPFSSRPSKQVLDPTVGVAEEPLTLTYLLALFPTCLQRIATLEAELKATKILHRDTVVLFAKRIKKLKSKLKSKKRKLVLSDSETKEEASPTTLDDVLTLSQLKARARAATIIYNRLKKHQSSSGLDFTDFAIPAGELDSAGGLDSAVAAGLTVPAEPSSPISDPSKGKAVATLSSPVSAPSAKELADQQAAILKAERQELLKQELKQSIDAEQVYLDSLLAQRVAKEQERESMASAAQSAHRQAELDRVALNLTNEEWISLLDQIQANPTLSAELLGADVSEDTFSIKMVELINRRKKMIAKIKAKVKRENPMTPAQQKEFMRTFVKNQTKDHHQHLKRSGETLESSESKKLKSSHNITQPAELQETTYVSASATIAAGDPIPAVTSVSAASSIPAATPIAAGVSTTVGASGSVSEATVLIIELLDSPRKDTSLPLDPETKEQDATLRKYSRKKSIVRRRTLPSAYKPKSDALSFDEDDLDAEFKRYLRQASNDDEPAEPISLALVSDITTWEIILTEFRLGEIYVLTRADGTVKWFSTLRELMYWAGRANLMVLYGLVSNKYKTERATCIGLALWIDLRILITSREERDASIIWDDQDQWQIRS